MLHLCISPESQLAAGPGARRPCSTIQRDVKDPALRTQAHTYLHIHRAWRTRIPAGWLAMCCIRGWGAGIEKGGAGEGQVRAAPRSIVLSRGGAPGHGATRRDAPRQLHLPREPVSMGMHPLLGAVARAFPAPLRLSAALLPREVRKPRRRNGGGPFSPVPVETVISPCVTGGSRHVRILYTTHRAFARKCTRGHGEEKGAPLMQLVPLTPSSFGVFVVRGQPLSDLANTKKTLPLVGYLDGNPTGNRNTNIRISMILQLRLELLI